MADTQLTPFDMGTFGSRTTPDMSQRLQAHRGRRARDVDRPGGRIVEDRPRICSKAEGGTIVHSGTGQKLEFGKLTKGQKLTKAVADDTAPTPPASWTVAGTFPAESRRPVVCDRRPSICVRHQASGHVVREDPPAAFVRRNARIG